MQKHESLSKEGKRSGGKTWVEHNPQLMRS